MRGTGCWRLHCPTEFGRGSIYWWFYVQYIYISLIEILMALNAKISKNRPVKILTWREIWVLVINCHVGSVLSIKKRKKEKKKKMAAAAEAAERSIAIDFQWILTKPPFKCALGRIQIQTVTRPGTYQAKQGRQRRDGTGRGLCWRVWQSETTVAVQRWAELNARWLQEIGCRCADDQSDGRCGGERRKASQRVVAAFMACCRDCRRLLDLVLPCSS